MSAEAGPTSGRRKAPGAADAPKRADGAPTRRGEHEALIAASLAGSAPTGAAGYRADRTLSLRVETVRQLRRRRTQLVAALVFVLPVLIAFAFKVGGTGSSSTSSNANSGALVSLARTGAANFALFTEFAVVGFLLVVIVALFCGDTVASEASWSSLRYLLTLPVPRGRLLRQKLTVALIFTVAVNLLIPAWAYLVGGAFFGWAPARSPVSGEFDNAHALGRLLIVVVYTTGQMLVVAALAFLLSVLTDAPLGAVGGATFIVVISNILDSITALDPYRQVLPTHFQYSWLDALGPSVVWSDMIRGTGLALVYASVLLLWAWRHFLRKDITS